MENSNFDKMKTELESLEAEYDYILKPAAEGPDCTVSFSSTENKRSEQSQRLLNYYTKFCNTNIDSILNAENDRS